MKEIVLDAATTLRVRNPREIKEYLDRYIIGQDKAKKVLSVAVYNHYKKVSYLNEHPMEQLDKSNVIIAGPTGSGKTAMIKRIAKMLDVPYYIADATTLTQAGYVGDDVESILVGLLRNSSWDLKKASRGIIAIDEIDKLAKKGASANITRDVVGEGVQQALLKIVEGDIVGVPQKEGRKSPTDQLIYINTKNILFIGMGAFSGMETIIEKRMNMNHIGYNTGHSNEFDIDAENFHPFDYMCTEDLRSFGMIPEFIGRFPIITNVNQLTLDDFKRILVEPQDSIIKQFVQLMEMDGIHLTFTDDAIESIAKVAMELGTGARGLRAFVESVLNNYAYDLCGDGVEYDLEITSQDILENLDDRYSKYRKELIAA